MIAKGKLDLNGGSEVPRAEITISGTGYNVRVFYGNGYTYDATFAGDQLELAKIYAVRELKRHKEFTKLVIT